MLKDLNIQTINGNDAIGGFFELELPSSKAPLYPKTVDFQSARAAFLGLLRTGKPQRVWMPYYICDTMLFPLEQADVDLAFYKLDERFHIADDICLQRGEWLFYVNYFGICTAYAESLLNRFDRKSVVLDFSQSLFSPPLDCLATIYSPRKFLGIPDGGMLVTSLAVSEPTVRDEASFRRALPLLKRSAFTPEEAYEEHVREENALCEPDPKKMSALTSRILLSVDYEEVCRARNRNFSYLHDRLAGYNLFRFEPCDVNGPLCYPLITEWPKLREFLISKRIFVPTYWKDVLGRTSASSTESSFVQNLIPLPCDQRYGEREMETVADVCLRYFEGIN